MREIKFRIWNEGECFSLSEAIFNEFIVIQRNREECFEIEKVYDDIVIEQFTGLIDKNGVEVYEGDIFNDGINFCIIEYIEDLARFVAYDGNEYHDLGKHTRSELIIGNIHQNPELLK